MNNKESYLYGFTEVSNTDLKDMFIEKIEHFESLRVTGS